MKTRIFFILAGIAFAFGLSMLVSACPATPRAVNYHAGFALFAQKDSMPLAEKVRRDGSLLRLVWGFHWNRDLVRPGYYGGGSWSRDLGAVAHDTVGSADLCRKRRARQGV